MYIFDSIYRFFNKIQSQILITLQHEIFFSVFDCIANDLYFRSNYILKNLINFQIAKRLAIANTNSASKSNFTMFLRVK